MSNLDGTPITWTPEDDEIAALKLKIHSQDSLLRECFKWLEIMQLEDFEILKEQLRTHLGDKNGK